MSNSDASLDRLWRLYMAIERRLNLLEQNDMEREHEIACIYRRIQSEVPQAAWNDEWDKELNSDS